MAELTFNPGASAVDGYVWRSVASEAFSTLRNNAGTNSDDSNTVASCRLLASATTNEYSLLERIVTLFDIGAIPAGSTIDSVNYRLYVESQDTGLTLSGYVVDSSGPASDTALAAGDYNVAGWADTAHSDVIAPGSVTTSAYNTWVLNATGIALVQTALDGDGIVKLGLRVNNDLANSAPSWSSSAVARVLVTTVEGSNDPELVVTYTPLSITLPTASPVYY